MTQTDLANLALSKIGESLIEDIDDTGDRRARLAKLHYEPTLREILRAHFWGFAMTAGELVSYTGGAHVTGTLVPDATGYLLNAGVPAVDGQETDCYSTDGTQTPAALGRWNLLIWVTVDAVVLKTYLDGVLEAQWASLDAGSNEKPTIDIRTVSNWFAVSGSPTGLPTVAPLVAPAGWTMDFMLPADFIKLRKISGVDGVKIERFDFRRLRGGRGLVTGDYDTITLEYVQYVDDPPDFDPLFQAAFVTLLASRLARAISGSEKLEGDLRALYESVDLPAARTADGYDSQSNENHPLREFLDGSLTGPRGDFFPDLDS